jgi:hypothetical protein
MKTKYPETPTEAPSTLDKEVGDILEEMTIDWQALTPIHQSIREQFPTISKAFDDLDEMVKARTDKSGKK